MKSKTYRPPVTVRELPPMLRQSKEGMQVLCPHCKPTHALLPGVESVCGTTLKLTAVQTVIPARTVRDKNLTCVKCHKRGRGEMVKYRNGYVHLDDCAPETKLLAEPPKFSRLAKIVFKLPEKLRQRVEKFTGKPQRVDEIDANGQETGRTLGYFFTGKVKAKA